MLQWFVDLMNGLSWGEIAWTALLVTPAVVLIHELGHAIPAAILSRDEVEVHVQVPPVPWKFDGLTTFNPERCMPLAIAVIALAGPAASFLTAAVAWKLLGSIEEGTAMYTARGSAVVGSFLGAILCLVPMRISETRDGMALESDGLLALKALRIALAR